MYNYGITCKNNYLFQIDIKTGHMPLPGHTGHANCSNNIGTTTLPHNMIPMLTTIDNKLRIKISNAKHEIDKNYKNGCWDYAKTLTNPYELIFSGSKKFIGKNIKYVRNSVCDYNPLSRSFFKMIEMSNTFLLPILANPNGIKSLHLAEGPGGFIEGICHMRKKLVNHTIHNTDTYYGITLIDSGNNKQHTAPNINSSISNSSNGAGRIINGIYSTNFSCIGEHVNKREHILGDCLKSSGDGADSLLADSGFDIPSWKKTTHFLRNNPNVIITSGHDGTGNLYHKCNILYIKHRFANKMDLVTADGGFDFSVDYNSQEYLACRLIFCEILCALLALKPGGTFICKFFDIINKLTVDFLYILQCKFKFLYIYKPKTSRLANSEKYIICINYTGILTEDEINGLFTVIDSFTQLNETSNTGDIKTTKNYMFLDGILSNVPHNFTKFINNISNSIIDKQIENIKHTLTIIHKHNQNTLHTSIHDDIIQKQRRNALQWCRDNHMRTNIF